MDNQMREALFAFAAAGYESRDVPPVADWTALVEVADQHRLLPLANRIVRDADCPPDVKRAFRVGALIQTLRSAHLRRELGKVLGSLAAVGVDGIPLKGPVLDQTAYPEVGLRPYSDLDILCREDDWLKAHEVLVAQGFAPLQPLHDRPPKVDGSKSYYHTQYQRARDNVRVEIHYDLWWYGLRPRLGEVFRRRAVPLIVGGTPTRVLSVEDQILHLAIHLHHHGFCRLIWFSDLALLLKRTATIDWDYLTDAARLEGVGLNVYYSLFYLERLLGVAAPARAMAALRPARLQRWVHDRLWPADPIVGLGVTDRVLFDFHEVPDAVELVLNLILTGRRREKLAHLGHLLVPSTSWLAYYYGTTDPAILRRRRMIHAPKLLAKTISEAAHAARHGVLRHSL